MRFRHFLPAIAVVLAGCVADDEDFRTGHEGVVMPVADSGEPVDGGAAAHEDSGHVGPWSAESLAVRAGRLSQAMREGEVESLMARIKADADTAWRDPEFRYAGCWGDGSSDAFDRYGDSTSHYNQFGVRLYIPNPFVNRYLSRKGDADVRRCEARAEAAAYAVYTEVKLLCAEYLRRGREVTLAERKTGLLKQMCDLSAEAVSNCVARSPHELIRNETAYRRSVLRLGMLRRDLQTLRGNIALLAQLPPDGLEVAPADAVDPGALSADRLCEYAFIRRPDLAQALAEYDLATASRGAAMAAYIPWFRFVEAAYRDESGSDAKYEYNIPGYRGGMRWVSGAADNEHNFNLEVAVNIPLFTWCGDSVKKSSRLRDLADARIRSLRDSIRREVLASLEGYRTAVAMRDSMPAGFSERMNARIDELAEGRELMSADDCRARIELVEHQILESDVQAAVDEARIRLESVSGGPLTR